MHLQESLRLQHMHNMDMVNKHLLNHMAEYGTETKEVA
jgi:hypothetical protein